MNIFPVTESTLSASHLGQLLQNNYHLSSGAVCKLIRTGMNHLYLVTDGGNRYVFRVYTFDWRTREEISEEVRLLHYLKQQHLSVSYPIADARGEYLQAIQAPEGLRFGVLFSFAEGKKNAKFSQQLSYLIGVAMAGIHQATKDYNLNRVSYTSKTLLTDAYQTTAAFFGAGSEEMAFVEKLTAYLVGEAEKVEQEQVRKGAVHLDMWFDNMHFEGESRVTIFDFDFCGNGLLCYDISYFLFQLYHTNLDEAAYELKAESFLSGYESVVQLSNEERRLLPTACLSVMLFFLSMQCKKFDTWSNIFLNEDHLKRFIGSLKKWIAFHQLEVV
ncbi:phosphotransferase [Pontibacter sp. SGAir0037]|uniref:phosphotransferase n=1 Tax=Pontibacter sp. SGAir0037 TaxID=2571030 RepID=UPI0010CD13D1|nr:phosphotransferase [Pontibacter sp. SGAir0037]QCR22973.1 aminoglycoside phosphotransferase [Pontibacter sp. SGAir0037]